MANKNPDSSRKASVEDIQEQTSMAAPEEEGRRESGLRAALTALSKIGSQGPLSRVLLSEGESWSGEAPVCSESKTIAGMKATLDTIDLRLSRIENRLGSSKEGVEDNETEE